jgi:hypothetical protein
VHVIIPMYYMLKLVSSFISNNNNIARVARWYCVVIHPLTNESTSLILTIDFSYQVCQCNFTVPLCLKTAGLGNEFLWDLQYLSECCDICNLSYSFTDKSVYTFRVLAILRLESVPVRAATIAVLIPEYLAI